jgi:hypothetical protein
MARYRYRQLFLFLLALTLPSSAIIGLAWLTIPQERELSEKRAADAQKQMLADIRQDLRAQLDRIKPQEITSAYSDPARHRTRRLQALRMGTSRKRFMAGSRVRRQI